MNKKFVLQVEETNESGRLEILDRSSCLVRFDYSNSFYGTCTLNASLALENGDLKPRKDTLSLEGHELKRGSYQGLCQSATRFFTTVVFRNSVELKNRLGAPKPKDRTTGLRMSVMPSLLWFDKE